jgi:hypothetical protein
VSSANSLADVVHGALFLATLESYLKLKKGSKADDPRWIHYYVDPSRLSEKGNEQLPESWGSAKFPPILNTYGETLLQMHINPFDPPSAETKFGPKTPNLGKSTNTTFVKKCIDISF